MEERHVLGQRCSDYFSCSDGSTENLWDHLIVERKVFENE